MKTGFFYFLMEDKKRFIIEKALDQFLKNGSKVTTMDDIANDFGLSKKTLYTMFENKEALLIETIDLLWNNFLNEVDIILNSNENPIQKLILIYKKGIDNICKIEPVFLLSLKKYHKKVMIKYVSYKKTLINDIVLKLLIEAKEKNYIESDVNLILFSEVNLVDFDERIWKNNFFETYSKEEILDYFISRKIRGILSKEYLYLIDAI